MNQEGKPMENSEEAKEIMESRMIREILAAAKAAVKSSADASSAAQEASKAAATAAENAKTALEEVEKLVNMLEGHKSHQRMSLPKMSSQESVNDSTHFDCRTKTLADESKDKCPC